MKKDSKLNYIIRVIAEKAKPEKIYLFGSRVNGKHNKESDYDILVVKKTKAITYKRILDVYNFFNHRDFSIDILVHTPEEIESWKNTPSSFLHHVLTSGKLVYEK
jgi:predicted nucleotidyltransferase